MAYIGGKRSVAAITVDTVVKPKKTTAANGQHAKPALSVIQLFEGVPEAFLCALEKRTKILQVGAGHVFFRPGERGAVLYSLEHGHAQTYRISGEEKLIIEDLKPPAIFGEMGCVGARVYHCFAQTMEPCRVRVLSRAQLEGLMRQFPSVTRRLLDLVSARFVRVLLDLEATSFPQLIPRLAQLLLDRADGEHGIHGMTHREMAEHLRVYRESATAALGELAGIVLVERKQIRILDRTRLERAARE